MKQSLYVVLMLASLLSSAQEKKFTIEGALPVTKGKYNVSLRWNSGERNKVVKVTNGRFFISGTIEGPIRATLILSNQDSLIENEVTTAELIQNSLGLFLDEGTITVTSQTTLTNAEVKGNSVVNDFQSYHVQSRPLTQLLVKIYEAKSHYTKNSESSQILSQMLKGYDELSYFEEMRFVKEHPSSPVSLFMVKKSLGYDINLVKALPMFALLTDTLIQSPNGKKLKEIIETAKKSMIGAKAVDFVQPDIYGSNITLSSFKGKYVLVDFWASWCIPCRAEGPGMIKAYTKFKDKNFEIFGVTLDENKEKWLKAIKDDSYTWVQAGDMKGWENTAALEYGINAIPFNFLLDPNGVIIARNLKGEALEKKLEEVLK